ncbi:hypothetical protein C4D60_Mb00t19290 [Musa balbisiana]|uniref:Uncharacterized protein n=1 Tax=Musa balbisiana TaxID=52838 RepID=A0A4S8I3M3_MUSBA|nr:hypothetical protein C4D60_Mb00t19290 [Musa balbisiana]
MEGDERSAAKSPGRRQRLRGDRSSRLAATCSFLLPGLDGAHDGRFSRTFRESPEDPQILAEKRRDGGR